MQSLDKHTKIFQVLTVFALIAVIATLDYTIVPDISLGIFYLLPVTLAAWLINRNFGILAAIISVVLPLFANPLPVSEDRFQLVSIWNATARLLIFLTVSILVSRLKIALARETESAHTDHLTGIANRRSFYEMTEAEMSRALRYNHPLTVMYIDVDDFKTVNDRFGHNTGDDLLRAVAQTLKRDVRAVDRVARLGGDEFAVLLPETGEEAARFVVRKLQKDLIDAVEGEERWPVTFSIGVITCAVPPCSVEEITKLADNLMYAAKREGKNKIKHEVAGEETTAA